MHSITIEHFQENDNRNLIFLFKKIHLNLIEHNQYYLTLNDILVTWSLKIHFILNEAVLKPAARLRELVRTCSSNPYFLKDSFELKFLVESSMLVNLLLDYSQDSSKIDKPLQPAPQVAYFNSHFSLVETVSIILNDVCLVYSSAAHWLDLRINDVSALVNMDDQSLCGDQTSELKRRQFFAARRFRIALDRANDRLSAERKLMGAKDPHNKLAEVKIDSLSVNYLFKYDFAKLLDHLLNLRKCLMLMHGIVRDHRNRPTASELSYDIFFSIKQIRLSVEDDPFEVMMHIKLLFSLVIK